MEKCNLRALLIEGILTISLTLCFYEVIFTIYKFYISLNSTLCSFKGHTVSVMCCEMSLTQLSFSEVVDIKRKNVRSCFLLSFLL